MQILPSAFAAMGKYAQFIVYKLVPNATRVGKTDKLPVDWQTGQLPAAGCGGSAIWTDFTTASVMAQIFGAGHGVGFSFAASDPFWFLDIDNCLLPNGTWSPLSQSICVSLHGAAIERSQSGKGLHVFGTGVIPPHLCRNQSLGLEFYHEGRFAALTGDGAMGDCSIDLSAQVAALVSTYFAPSEVVTNIVNMTDGARDDWSGPIDDEVLIKRMLASKPSAASAFGGKATFVELWDGDVEALSRTYPSTAEGQPYGASEADAALAAHLHFWTGGDKERMKRLMRRSGLVREKYEREDYLQRTVDKICASGGDVYQEKKPDSPKGKVLAAKQEGRLRNGHTFVTAEDQVAMWKGYTYVTNMNMMLTDVGEWVSPEAFARSRGGYTFAMQTDNAKPTNNAFDAFTHSQLVAFPKADRSAFKPNLPVDELWYYNGRSYANTYRKPIVIRREGDITPFTQHLEKILPIERDRQIILAYMAAIIQFPGVKFQWCPLIQGTQGNGKSLLSRCVEYAVGEDYTHYARPSELAEKFNDWMLDKIFINIEDIYYPEGRTEIIEVLKPMITNSRQPIRAMRQSERTMDVCANFIINSNYKDAIRLAVGDRRWCVMFCAQQKPEDLIRDEMPKSYFGGLYDWLREDGYAIVAEFLYTYQIPAEFGLECLRGRAPETSSTGAAIAAGMGRIEAEIIEAIQAGRYGFCGGWISSLELDKLLQEKRMEKLLPRSKRRDVLNTLGYDWHPNLRDGRSTKGLGERQERPVLFTTKDHHINGATIGVAIAEAYEVAQAPGAVQAGIVQFNKIGATV